MSRHEKLIFKLLSLKKTFTYDELKSLLRGFEYEESPSGKTSGSRVAFVNSKTKHIIRLHKPHPHKTLKRYQMDYLIEELRSRGLLK